MSVRVVKEEVWEGEGAPWASAGAPWAALYAGHEVKPEIVLGPEVIQTRNGAVVLPVASGLEGDCSPGPKDEATEPSNVSIHSTLKDSSGDLSLREGKKPISLKPCYVKLERIAQKKHKCPICQKAIKFNLKTHILTHTQEEIDTIKVHKKQTKETKRFECHICKGRFTRRPQLRKHLEAHATQDPFTQQLRAKIPKGKIIKNDYTCDVCGKRISRKDGLVGHLAKHANEGPFPCGVCKQPFKASWELVEHIKLATCKGEVTNDSERVSDNAVLEPHSNGVEHVSSESAGNTKSTNEVSASSEDTGDEADNSSDEDFTLETDEELFYCGVCEKQYDSLGEHKCKACKFCKRKFKNASDLATHARVHTGERPYSCKICDQRFRFSGDVNVHIRRAHTDDRPHGCQQCEKRFASRHQLAAHIRVHTGDKPYSCKVCKKRFSRYSTLDKHKLIHTGELPFACEFCPKRCRQKAHLNAHLRTHTGEKPFPCHVCGKNFTGKSHLVIHSRTHSGEKPYSCDLCVHTFANSSALTLHKRIHHTGDKPFECKVCGKRFARKSHMKEHVESHTRTWAYSCGRCPRKFQRRQYLRHHEKRHRERELRVCVACGRECAGGSCACVTVNVKA